MQMIARVSCCDRRFYFVNKLPLIGESKTDASFCVQRLSACELVKMGEMLSAG